LIQEEIMVEILRKWALMGYAKK